MSDPEQSEPGKEQRIAKSVYQEIQELPVSEKIKLAMTGDKEARSVLIKDSNKKVQEAVLDSPRITDAEIVAVANSRSASEELLRKIADNRHWMKNYQVRSGLVNNPKTPVPVALRLVSGLMLADLRRLAKSKGVAHPIAQLAKREAARRAG